jgi:hypothetical protein
MRKWLQRIRGALGIGLTWAAGWAPIGAITGLVTGAVLGVPLVTITANYALMFSALGFIGGTIFSTVLGVAEGRRRFDQLSLPRFVAWGALGGLVLGGLAVSTGLLGAGLSTLGAVIAGTLTLLGAGSAAGTLAIARAAHGRALLNDGDDVSHAGLRGERARQLTGKDESER